MIDINKIYNEDCLLTMKRMSDNFIDLTVTSPPYDNLRTYNGFTWDFESIAKELYRITKPGGVIVWVVGDATINGSETGTSFTQALFFKQLGFNLHDTMIYLKENPIPLTHNRYEQQFEYMFVFTKGKPKTFNPIMEKCVTNGNCSWRRNAAKSIDAAVRNRDEVTTTKESRIKYNVWTYVCGCGSYETGNHPAPFPEQLAKDHILSWSNQGDIIYDPFMGSGTTGKMAVLSQRNYIGSEISEEYCNIANKRISWEQRQQTLF